MSSLNSFVEEGFRVVKSKRSSRRAPSRVPALTDDPTSARPSADLERVSGRIKEATEELRLSEYWGDVRGVVERGAGSRPFIQILCYGLGHFAECGISRYQLALLLLLRDTLKVEVFAHDPTFDPSECELLRNFGIKLIEENEEGRREIPVEGVTVAYLPHCPKQLTNNFLWANWGEHLKNCILICNSFTRLLDSYPNRILADAVPFILKIIPYTKEVTLENNFKFTDIFNDTSVHFFPEANVKDLNRLFWKKGEQPAYEDTTEFITKLMIEKLKL